MPWRLETWSPEYVLPERVGEEEESRLEVKTGIEGAWEAQSPKLVSPEQWPKLYLVDGRQRIEAQLIDAEGRRAVLATVVAGAVLRDEGGIRPAGDPIKKHLLLHAGELQESLPDGLRHYQTYQVRRADPTSIRSSLTEAMRRLETELVNQLEEGYVIVDGQLYPGGLTYRRPGRVLGYTKTQAATYLAPGERGLLYRLEPYQRTPIFFLPGRGLGRAVDVYSWYLRLPLQPSTPFHGASALLRVESPTLEPAEAKELADLSVSLFCAMASSPTKDPRAPQNLVPVGGLEQWLGQHMGSLEVVRRRIVEALFA
ncbi:hypothetical protein DV704_09415 [Meiothermus sp. QL-1]|uniref:DNA double-strand break repair nuclease NurA n=1 Tax=Meiothermus sp. QL-1 TaxID=2058095 RepID=UPI000E0CA096|nr:DNA double-strand break repair nuclease NurA [Meiothermus sp. QL-1]RDI94876.1 hypothetical protein DV704_09415 [Meiothermus sp. QL-1]